VQAIVSLREIFMVSSGSLVKPWKQHKGGGIVFHGQDRAPSRFVSQMRMGRFFSHGWTRMKHG